MTPPTRTTTIAELCIAAIGLNAYRHERSCHDLIILSCVKPIDVFQLIVDSCTPHVYCTYSYNDDWLWLSGSNVRSCISMHPAITTVWQSRQPPHHMFSPRSMGPPSKFVYRLTMLAVETLGCCSAVKTA